MENFPQTDVNALRGIFNRIRIWNTMSEGRLKSWVGLNA